MTVSVAERDPVAPGVKVTLSRQVPSGCTVPEVGQVVADPSLKSAALAPVMVMLVMFRAPLVLVSVSVELSAELVLPTVTEPKARVPGTTVAVGMAVPVPVSVTICGLVGSASVKVSVPTKFPAEFGVKVTVTVQLFPAPRLVPQVLLLMANTGRFETTLVILVEVFALLVRVTDCAALVVFCV